MTDTLKSAVVRRYLDLNGSHPMTAEDDAYVDEYYAPLAEVSARRGVDPDEVRRRMLDGQLPLPSYLRSDGTEMVWPELFELADAAGGLDALPGWFGRQRWRSAEQAADEWSGYLSGQYVCLRELTPERMARKNELGAAIDAALAAAAPDSPRWLADLHALVDELDVLELPFTPYDRRRFGGPVSRDAQIDAVRERFPLEPVTPPGR
ncbi:DUF6058 family natural product biosynthesis protein [Actinosynnema sp. NPDC020468]|uniref:DUF6058 family natural product biosynthesis protein n=1 Tax=Actinosynnema sp. NPDC020468 TaxID=3154488 RepID=UPI0033E7F890